MIDIVTRTMFHDPDAYEGRREDLHFGGGRVSRSIHL